MPVPRSSLLPTVDVEVSIALFDPLVFLSTDPNRVVGVEVKTYELLRAAPRKVTPVGMVIVLISDTPAGAMTVYLVVPVAALNAFAHAAVSSVLLLANTPK